MSPSDTGLRSRLSRRSFILIDTTNLFLAALYIATAAASITDSGCGGAAGPFPFLCSFYAAFILARGARSLVSDFPDETALAAHHRESVWWPSAALFGAALLATLPLMRDVLRSIALIFGNREIFKLYLEMNGFSWMLQAIPLALIATETLRVGDARPRSQYALSFGIGALAVIAHLIASVVNSFAGGCLPTGDSRSWLAMPLGAGLGLAYALRRGMRLQEVKP